jgi:hypothetical protein
MVRNVPHLHNSPGRNARRGKSRRSPRFARRSERRRSSVHRAIRMDCKWLSAEVKRRRVPPHSCCSKSLRNLSSSGCHTKTIRVPSGENEIPNSSPEFVVLPTADLKGDGKVDCGDLTAIRTRSERFSLDRDGFDLTGYMWLDDKDIDAMVRVVSNPCKSVRRDFQLPKLGAEQEA